MSYKLALETFRNGIARGEKPSTPVCADCHNLFRTPDNGPAPAYAELDLPDKTVYLPICQPCLDRLRAIK